MEDHIKRHGQAVCPECGQKLGFEVKNPKRKMQLIKCPICKKFSWTATDKVEACLIQLARYEESGFYPEQLLALRTLWKECMKYPELKQKLEEWEARFGADMAKKKSDRGGYACMPLKKNVPEGKLDWSLVQCPECGNWCWRTPLVGEAEKSGAIALCTECALRKGVK